MSSPKRLVKEALFGITCYELDEQQTTKEEAVYLHRGIVGTEKDAKLWLQGKAPKHLIKVYDDKGIAP